MKDFADVTRQKVIDSVVQISLNKKIDFDKDKAADYTVRTFKNWLMDTHREVRKDMEQADFAGGLEKGKTHALVRTVMFTSYTHACVKYAEKILDHSKIPSNDQ